MSEPVFNLLEAEGIPLPPTRADAIPDLDAWGWDEYWSINDWLTWHTAMKNTYGLDHANQNFRYYWYQQSGGAAPLSSKFLDDNFISYVDANGLGDIIDDSARALIQVRRLPGSIAQTTNAALGAINSTAAAAQALNWLFPAALALWLFGKYLADPYGKTKRALK